MSNEKRQALTVKDFKMWLQGVEEMQSEEWSPDARQWKVIREKISDLIETTQQSKTQEAQASNVGAAGPQEPVVGNPPPRPRRDPIPPPPGSGLNVGPTPPTAPRSSVSPSGLPITMSAGQGTTKTPDVEGPYNPQKSAFL